MKTTKNESMNREFLDAFKTDWLSWIGQPLLYDSGLCVNRNKEDLIERNKFPDTKLEV
jgi:hypothetical protein